MIRRNKKTSSGKRADSSRSSAMHSSRCTVCKHVQKEEVERRYLSFEASERLAQEFGLSDEAVNRHARYFALDAKRVADTERVLEHLIARGFSQLKKIDGRLTLEAIKELNKVRGKHKQPQQNPVDVDRARRIADENRAWAEEQIARFCEKYQLSRDAAIEQISAHAPQVREWVN